MTFLIWNYGAILHDKMTNGNLNDKPLESRIEVKVEIVIHMTYFGSLLKASFSILTTKILLHEDQTLNFKSNVV